MSSAKRSQGGSQGKSRKPNSSSDKQAKKNRPLPVVRPTKSVWDGLLPSGAKVTSDGKLHVQFNFRPIDKRQTLKSLKKNLADSIRPLNSPLGQNPRGGHMSVIRGPAAPREPNTAGLSDCAALYAKANTNPWGEFTSLPCTPSSPPTPTQRWRSLTRGTFFTGTNAVGYVIVQPYNAANNANSLVPTLATYAGTTGTAFTSAGATLNPSPRPSLPYTSAQLGAGLQARLVAMGLRCRNISQATSVGGMLIGFQGQDQTNLGSFTPAQVMAFPDAVVVPQALQPGSDWNVLLWRPSAMSSLDWQPDDGVSANANFTLLFCAIAPSGSAVQQYEFELVEFWEFQGATTSGLSLPELVISDADSVGLDRVLDAAQRAPLTLLQDDWNKHMAIGIADAVAHSDTVAKTVEDIAGVGGLFAQVPKMVSSLLSMFGI